MERYWVDDKDRVQCDVQPGDSYHEIVTLHWSTAKPEAPGWYWWVDKSFSPLTQMVAELYWRADLLIVQFVGGPAKPLDVVQQEHPKGQWAGPIQPPEE